MFAVVLLLVDFLFFLAVAVAGAVAVDLADAGAVADSWPQDQKQLTSP